MEVSCIRNWFATRDEIAEGSKQQVNVAEVQVMAAYIESLSATQRGLCCKKEDKIENELFLFFKRWK